MVHIIIYISKEMDLFGFKVKIFRNTYKPRIYKINI